MYVCNVRDIYANQKSVLLGAAPGISTVSKGQAIEHD